MTTAYTSLLGLALPVTGELSGTWGDTVNDYITQYLDASVAGTQTISGSQTAVTLSKTTNASLSQAGSGATGSSQYNVINCTGNPASMLTVTVPAASKTYVVVNATSTNQDVKIVGAGPTTGVTLVAGERAIIAWNGSDFIKVATSTADGVTTLSFGSTGLTPSTATSGAVTVAGTLVAANGGTGQSSYTTGDLLYATGSTTLSKLGIGTNGQILTSTGTAPQWSTLSGVAVTTFSAGTTGFTPSSATSGAVTLAGTLATTNGGTGLTSFTANGVVYASSSSALTTGSALQFDGSRLGVGISPTQTIDANGAVLARSNLIAYTALVLQRSSSSLELPVAAYTNGSGNILASNTKGDIVAFGNVGGDGVIFANANLEAMRLTTTGLGIGTSSPGAKLDVAGTFNGTQAVFGNTPGRGLLIGTALNGGVNEGSTVLNARGAGNGQFLLQTDGTTRLTISDAGNLGLGVTPSAWESARKAIQLSGTASYFAANSVAVIAANNFFDGQNKYIGTGYATQYAQSAGQHIWLTAPSWNGTGSDVISFTQAMTLDASGNLGIGTSSPTGRLHISTASGNTDFVHNVTGAGTAARTTYQRSGSVVFYAGLGAWSGTDTYQIANTSGPLTTIDTSGNLGVGSATPSSYGKLQVKQSGTAFNSGLAVTTQADDSSLFIYDSGSAWTFLASYLGTGSYKPIIFNTSNAERMQITAAGFTRPVAYADTVSALGNTGTATTINLQTANVFTATLTGNCTFTLSNPIATGSSSFTLILTNDGTAGRTVAWAGGSFVFPGGAAALSRTTTANAVDVWVFFTPNGGTTWYGNIAMKDMKA